MEDLDFDVLETTGVQNDGEPVAVVKDPVPEPAPEPETAQEPEATEPQDPAEDEPEEAPRKKTGSQRLREKLAREAQEKEYWKAQALKKQEPAEPTSAPSPTSKPRQDDYETHEAWVEAVTDWKVEQKLAERQAKDEAHQRLQTWQQKTNEARKKFEDFDDALESAPAPSPIVADVLNESHLGAEVAYHLATHPDEYERINRMRPAAAALELGRIEARLSGPTKKTDPAKPAPTPSKAPKPPTPVAAHAAVKPADDGRLESY